MREIMTRAWEIRKTTGKNMSQSLKEAWAEAKTDRKPPIKISAVVYGPSRKQAGCVFAAWKKGVLNISKEVISFMYDLSETRCYANSNRLNAYQELRYAFEYFFAGAYTRAEKCFEGAMNIY